MNIIFHIDFDSYFVSALRIIHPELQNKMVAIGKSIAISLSYEAKKMGARVGMYRHEISKIAPGTIWRSPNFAHFMKISNQIFEYIINNYSNKIQIFSIDECFIDVTHLINKSNIKTTSVTLAKRIQKDIKLKFGIPISIGISTTYFLAKMSTNLAKPYGILFTYPNEIEKRFFHLDIREYFGIGKSLENKLRSNNINTIGEFYRSFKNKNIIKEIFKNTYLNYWNNLNGIEIIKREEMYTPKSISNIKSIDFLSIDNINDISYLLSELVASVWIKAKNRNMLGKVAIISIKYDGQNSFINKQFKSKQYIETETKLNEIAQFLFKEYWNNKPIKGLGFGISELQYKNNIYFQKSIFEEIKPRYKEDKLITHVNSIVGSNTLIKASDIINNNSIQKPKLKFLDQDNESFIRKGKIKY
ncbi:Y-family DNA polymerase [Mycoplasma phocimorsus]|uniref:Y-family DNA polymerase n=1 Tax=Mycoplasma phocimorsus TaxID=3045839 RepID=UPI0024C00265|nr:DNA polymerase IV [Mycoplasma phocimorsus]MDJ1646911.1 DNA polymerase IV [Mycoplasma phocimorsus]